MTARRRIALFVCSVSLVVGGAGYLALRGAEVPVSEGVSHRGPVRSVAAVRARVLEEIRGATRRRELAVARDLDPTDEPHPGPRPEDLARLRRAGERTEAVARRFFATFLRYELGELDAAIEAKLRGAATAGFARELIAAPPRVASDAQRPAPGELGALDFVASDSDPERERLLKAELVGQVERGGERSPFAIELVREQGGWRVAGIAR